MIIDVNFALFKGFSSECLVDLHNWFLFGMQILDDWLMPCHQIKLQIIREENHANDTD